MNKLLLIVFCILVASISQGTCQTTNIVFTGIVPTSEQAVQLYWASTNHELYAVQYANALDTNADGTTAWSTLYDQYPSQGTNTFIGDFGNYNVVPPIPHPKYMPMRFYRILDEGADSDTTDTPSITITSPTNGSALTGQITISVTASCTNLPVVTTALYVDGQEMDPSVDGSNYVINTCEWWNGPHTLFAVATARSGLTGPDGVFPVYTSHGVSQYVPVTFSNLISQVAFSQWFFQPSMGETQEVTAAFAANCNWTLQILDDNSNVVRNVSGTGDSMAFGWDGTGDGGTNLPDSDYYYYISAVTNGEPEEVGGGGSGGSGGGTPPTPEFASDSSSALWAVAPDSETAVPLVLYPPGFDTNDFTIFAASPSEVMELNSPAREEPLDTPEASPAYSGPSGQSTLTPTRPPTAPTKNSLGDIGVAFFAHLETNTYSVPLNGYPLSGSGGEVKIENSYGNVTFYPIPEALACANDFETTMRKKGWWGPNSFNLSGGSLQVNDLRSANLGGHEIFGNVNVGLFIDHGSYGTTADMNHDANGSLMTYMSSDNPSDRSAPWLRLSEFGLGGNLRFMAILACNTLRSQNYNSMLTAGVLPIKSNLHLLCSASTYVGCGDVGGLWAQNMVGGFFQSAETVQQAWYDAGTYQYHHADMSGWTYGTISFRVAGQDNCFGDTLKSYQGSTSGNITQQTEQVYP